MTQIKNINPGTVPGRAAIMDQVMARTQPTIENLFARWKDEKDYEDFNDYRKVINDLLDQTLPVGSKVISISKKFKITLVIPGFPYKPVLLMTSRSYSWASRI